MRNPWRKLPPSACVLPEDEVKLKSQKRTIEGNIEFKVLPIPFMGDLRKARVILLLLNPGFSNDGMSDIRMHEHCAKHRCSDYLQRSRNNLLHKHGKRPAFYMLDERFAFFVGFDWWYKNCRPVIEKIGFKRVQNHLACVNFFPYHSARYTHLREMVPSQKYSIDLVKKAMKAKKIIIIMKGAKIWKREMLEDGLERYPELFTAKNPRKSILSPKNLGPKIFEKCCRALDSR